ncbi:TonB system transport protein ExbD [Methylobacterium sp. J-026]|uniref:TonB system transport protein ExbD n=1 Tax=Methylobacterium sp. J-026 TaxID=2836624 RepID=UPI001FB9BFC4|nr:TonB system transport protein ExbD [Methylobacterium sp. J-026]MCJ2134993.1 TonB system transport protein ExbD [Methylobacterium sp. J-026]
MAFQVGSGDDGDLSENADINITPFIDVILVLLIIFMVAAPLSTVTVPVELPTSNAKPQPHPSKPIFLSVRADLSLALGEEPVARPALAAALDAAANGSKEERIFLRSDKGVPYGELMQVMNLLRAAGYLKIGLVGLEDATGAP